VKKNEEKKWAKKLAKNRNGILKEFGKSGPKKIDKKTQKCGQKV
jgi:hypothetical protein